MIGEPTIEERNEQPYMRIRSKVPMHDLSTVIPQSIGEVFGWLEQHGVPPAGAPLVRYFAIDMPSKLDLDIGVPVANAVSGNGRIARASLPAGRYATLIYTGPYDRLMQANAALLDWIKERGHVLDCSETPDGDGFAARFESYLTDPEKEPDPSRWQTQVSIRLAD